MPQSEAQAFVRKIDEHIGRQLVQSFYRPLIAISGVMAVVFWIPGVSPVPIVGFLTALVMSIAALTAAWLSNRGRARIAAIVMVGTMTILCCVYFFLFGWMEDRGSSVFPLLVLMAGMLAGPMAALVTSILAALMITLSLVLVGAGVEPINLDPDNPIANGLQAIGIVALTAALIGHSARLLRRSLRERLDLERRRQEAQRLESLGRLAGGVAHDFNNLLTPITGHASLLADDQELDEEIRRTGRQIGEAARRASDLVTQLMAFGRRAAMEPTVLDLNQQVERLKDILTRVIRVNVEQKYHLARDLARVRADPGRIEQVIINLAINASEAMPQGGQLTLETSNVVVEKMEAGSLGDLAPGRYVLLSVTDTGLGMSPETLNRIYEPFFSTKEDSGGTGLGLATVYGIVRQSGGAIHVNSEPGQGTVFKVYLPAALEQVDAPTGPEFGQAPRTLAGDECVLVVDDMQQVRKVTAAILTQRGYKVLQAADGYEALKISTDSDPPVRLLITDLVMPKMGGRELAQKLEKQNPDLKVVFISGYGENGIANSKEQLPEGLFLMKPFTAAQLLEKTRQALDD